MHHSPHLRQHRLHGLGVTKQESQRPEGGGTGITLTGKENNKRAELCVSFYMSSMEHITAWTSVLMPTLHVKNPRQTKKK